MIAILLILSMIWIICLIVFASFLSFRNEWLCRKLLKLTYDESIPVEERVRFLNGLWSYQDMLTHFWIWDLNKMRNYE